jgi:tetratricopeptide (TPR) repeat protein
MLASSGGAGLTVLTGCSSAFGYSGRHCSGWGQAALARAVDSWGGLRLNSGGVQSEANSLEAMVRAAAVLRRQNRMSEALDTYRRLLARWPGHGDSWFNLALLQRRLGFFEDALLAYQRAIDAGVSRPEEAHLNRAVIYTDHLALHAAAELELRRAISLNPAFLPALLNLANLCEDLGRRAEAAALYERLLSQDPLYYEALARLGNLLPPGEATAAFVPRLERALADPGASAADRASLGFALGRALDALGEYPRAFRAYEHANRASRASVAPEVSRYDRAGHTEFIDRLIDAGPAVAADDVTEAPQPVFVCGMFRSGSTLAEQLLAAQPGVASAGEFDFIPRLVSGELAPYPEAHAGLSRERLTSIAAAYRAQLARLAPGAAYVIDKRPDNFLYIGLIKRLFPRAKIIHTRRDALDNCLSIYFLHLDQRMSYALDLLDIGHYFREYRRLMAHWRALYADDIFDFDYDELVRGPQETLRRAAKFLGNAWDPQGPVAVPPGRAIKTASVWQVREPLYRSSSGRARNYAQELQDLRLYLAAPA